MLTNMYTTPHEKSFAPAEMLQGESRKLGNGLWGVRVFEWQNAEGWFRQNVSILILRRRSQIKRFKKKNDLLMSKVIARGHVLKSYTPCCRKQKLQERTFHTLCCEHCLLEEKAIIRRFLPALGVSKRRRYIRKRISSANHVQLTLSLGGISEYRCP